MPIDRGQLKAGIAAMLDGLAIEHPLGHQDAYARRYLMKTKNGASLELMYEQAAKTPANIWVLASHAKAKPASKIKQTASPVTKLYAKIGKRGKPVYGRHSALEKMPVLGMAELVCLRPETLAEAGEILDHLLEV
jgi:hypothetical protein